MTADPFTTLGLEPRFLLPRSRLDARHRELSKTLHPDRFAGAPASERRRALNEAINVNHAYRTLKDPVQRGQALLARLVPEASAEAAAEERADPAFLMEIMELRESLSEARKQPDLARVRSLAEGVRQQEAALISELNRCFDEGPLAEWLMAQKPEAPDLALLAQARASLGKLRYLRRFLAEVDAIEDELG